jgi:WXG100 family type VII secretion target
VSGFLADLDALLELTERISTFTSNVERLGDDLDGEVRRLHAQWSGAAADAHGSAHDQWRASAKQLQAAADRLRAVVTVAHSNYHSAVSANLRMWG